VSVLSRAIEQLIAAGTQTNVRTRPS